MKGAAMVKRAAITVIVLCLVSGMRSTAAFAQQAQQREVPLSSLLPQLYADVVFFQKDFFREYAVLLNLDPQDLDQQVDATFATSYQVIDLMSAQLSSFPLGSAAGGFTWTVDPVTGAFLRSSDSFGPLFAERAPTIGKRRWNVGAGFQRVTFDHLYGKKLSGGEVVTYTGAPRVRLFGGAGVFFVNSLDLRLTTETLSVFASYGVGDRLDLGVALPITRVEMNARLASRFGFTDTGAGDPRVTQRSGTVTGVGDIVARVKYNLVKWNGGGLTEAVDVRLPTGDERNLLGAAGPQVKVYLIASSTMRRLTPHVNFGYTISGESKETVLDDPQSLLLPPPEELNFVAGADLNVSSRMTAAFDVIGRTLRDVGTLEWKATDFGDAYRQFYPVRGANLNLWLGSAGVKVNPAANLLLSVNVLVPLKSYGLTDDLTWMVGFDYSF
jgi:hypothetical protein